MERNRTEPHQKGKKVERRGIEPLTFCNHLYRKNAKQTLYH